MTLLLYVHHHTQGSSAIEIDMDSTTGDLYDELNVKYPLYKIMYQDSVLSNMSDILADLGICMEASLVVSTNIEVKKIYRTPNKTSAYALMSDNTVINSVNKKKETNVKILIGTKSKVIDDGVCCKHKTPYLSKFKDSDVKNFKDIIEVCYSRFYCMDNDNVLYYINLSLNTICHRSTVLSDAIGMCTNNIYGIIVWDISNLYTVVKGIIIKTIPIRNIIDVSTWRDTIAVLTSNYIYILDKTFTVKKHIPCNNIVQISTLFNVLGCMSSNGDIHLYYEDREEYVGNALGFALIHGYKYFGYVNVFFIEKNE